MDKKWLSDPDGYSEIVNESSKLIVYPNLKQIIKKFKLSTLFDYGSNDGSFINYLKPNYEVGLYDISRKAISLARKKVKWNAKFFNSKSSIPSNYYDVVIFSLVMMAIPTKKSINSTFKTIKRIKRRNGKLIVTVTHPCFREEKFSSFKAQFSNTKKFNYFAEGEKFKVTLRDIISKKEFSFYDFHWSLSFTINTLILNGFKIIEIMELSDWAPGKKFRNNNFPPYLLIICE